MIDLHTHTTASDGSLTPKEIVLKAKQIGITILGITDHDTINGVEKAIKIGRENGIKIIPGVELGTDYNNFETHILGYFNENNYKNIKDYFDWILEKRYLRNLQMIQNLQNANFDITIEEVLKKADGGTPGRPHIAQLLVEKGYANSIGETFNKILLRKDIFIKREKTTSESAIKAILKAGGIPVFAHPIYLDKENKFEEALKNFISYGLQGIEVFHSDHTKRHTKKYIKSAKVNNLLITGGSDFHGENKDGVLLGGVKVDNELVEAFIKKIDGKN